MQAAQALTGNTWTELAAFAEQRSRPSVYTVSVSPDSANAVEVACPGLPGHPDGAPTAQDEGLTLQPGQSVDFTSTQGRIQAVYARSSGATITHAATAD